MPDDTPAPLMRIRDVCAYLAIGPSHLHAMRARGHFPAPCMVGGAPRWRRADVDAWLASRRGEPERLPAGRPRAVVLTDDGPRERP